jgi:CHAD domain-containing protein
MTDSHPTALLSSAANVAVTRIVRDRLDVGLAAADRLADAVDPDSLHDFRVALRRLRSALRAYRPWLGRAASRKLRSALRDLSRATNRGRDAEVQADWLESQERDLPDDARAGTAKLVARLRKHRTLPARELQAEFRITADKISNRLEFQDGVSAGFAAVYEVLLAQHAADAAACLATVTNADQVEEAHEARIAVKRLRYLLEPLAEEFRQAPPLLERVKQLQDLLGELHDSHVLDDTLADAAAARRLSRRAYAALAAENAKRRAAVFANLEQRWLGGAATSFFEQIRRLAARA